MYTSKLPQYVLIENWWWAKWGSTWSYFVRLKRTQNPNMLFRWDHRHDGAWIHSRHLIFIHWHSALLLASYVTWFITEIVDEKKNIYSMAFPNIGISSHHCIFSDHGILQWGSNAGRCEQYWKTDTFFSNQKLKSAALLIMQRPLK